MRVRGPVVPAIGGNLASLPSCVDVGAVREPPEESLGGIPGEVMGALVITTSAGLMRLPTLRSPPAVHRVVPVIVLLRLNTPVVPAYPGTTAHCAIAAPALTLIICVIHTPATRRSREGGNLASLPLCGCRGGSRTARRSRHPKRIPNPTTTAHCAIAAPAPTLVICVIHAPTSPLPLGEG